MAKIQKKFSNSLVIGLICVVMVGLTGIGLVMAYGENIVNNFYGETEVNQAPTGEISFGAFAEDTASQFTDVYVTNDLVVGEGIGLGTVAVGGGTLADGYKDKVVTLTITNTTSAGILNPEGETIYVYDGSWRIQTPTTSIVYAIMGTSTQAFISPEDSAIDFPTVNGGDQSIFAITTNFAAGASADTSTSTQFRADNYGLDTRDVSGIWYVIPVLSTEYLTCYASTTPSVDTTQLPMGTYQAQCQFKYYVIED